MPDLFPNQLLEYSDPPSGEAFVTGVMRTIRRERRIRKTILFISGSIGALFGIAGATTLSDSMVQFFTTIFPASSSLSVSVAILATVLFLGWLLNDETINGQ